MEGLEMSKHQELIEAATMIWHKLALNETFSDISKLEHNSKKKAITMTIKYYGKTYTVAVVGEE